MTPNVTIRHVAVVCISYERDYYETAIAFQYHVIQKAQANCLVFAIRGHQISASVDNSVAIGYSIT